MTAQQTIALIAHDGKKADMVAFALQHKAQLARYHLIATNTTGRLIRDKAALDVECMLSGPLGGDAQIAALIATKQVAAVFFFVDPLTAQAHDPDIQGLLRICNVHNIPLATNPATALYILTDQQI